ncbi:hypothetical protein QEN19_003630 [Hanseniaspora menglaensis]
MVALFKTAHLLTYSFIFGSTTYYSYIVSPKMFKVLDKDSFSLIQSQTFKQFFIFQNVASILLPLLAFKTNLAIGKSGYYASGVCFFSSLSNLLWLQPLCQDIKQERRKLDLTKAEDALRDEELRKQFGKFHGLSLLMNVIYSVGLLTYGFKYGSLI